MSGLCGHKKLTVAVRRDYLRGRRAEEEDSREKEEAYLAARKRAEFYAGIWGAPLVTLTAQRPARPDELIVEFSEEGVALLADGMRNQGDFERFLGRLRPGCWEREMLIKTARFRKKEQTADPLSESPGKDKKRPRPNGLRALDATAGMGEDALILAAAGFTVELAEQDPIIHLLLEDSITRAREGEEIYLRQLVSGMRLLEGNSIPWMRAAQSGYWDLIYLDPMFPERKKSALVKKKFQLLHYLERPAADEQELLQAALSARPKKIVIKRPLKGPDLGGQKPSYRIRGKAIRYDVIVPSHCSDPGEGV